MEMINSSNPNVNHVSRIQNLSLESSNRPPNKTDISNSVDQ